MTIEQVLMAEHQLISEATEWGAGQEVVFQGFISGVEAMTGKLLELMKPVKIPDGVKVIKY